MTDVKSATPTASPVKVGAVFAGANLNGAFVRDTRLINEIARRGIPTAKWWAMDLPPQLGVDGETVLFHAARFARVPQRFLGETLSQCLMERLGIVGSCVGNKISPKATDWGRSRMSRWALRKVAAEIVRGVDRDQRLMRRIATALDESGVTHVMPMISLLAPFLLAARQYCSREIRVVALNVVVS